MSRLSSYSYQYDAAGNVMQVRERYGAGVLGNRLVNEQIVTAGAGTVGTAYMYDLGHSRTQHVVTDGGHGDDDRLCKGTSLPLFCSISETSRPAKRAILPKFSFGLPH